ncbi:MAG: AarF/ABC1/UbiB kinase family protein [Candidatus Euphemobacter frigidus]|nr:AarF/ABC1/UbiB kinase family protein [Candidatus Euphemobacter frigidus]MDP8274820.1 AarF/ABC1/UbiB kinase family protein [Candidatus Euphemobacter frigidus]
MLSIRKIAGVGRTYRHIGRYRQIIRVLFKYGFGELLDTLKIEQIVELGLQKLHRRRHEEVEVLTGPQRFKLALEELGPTFVKLGQILSTRPDLIPLAFIEELTKLQDEVPPFPYREVREIIKAETGQFPEDLFGSFEEKPMAAASIGQAHKARLKDGTDVVVKVQRPRIRKTIEIDLEIMLHLAGLMERHLEELRVIRPSRIVEEFAHTLEEEIAYTVEASHIERFAAQFKDDETIRVPRVYRDMTTERILTMEDIHGVKGSDLDSLKKENYDLPLLAERGADLIMKQIFVYGFFHGDPHPGNIFFLPENIICYVDFGMMGRINRQEREDFADLLMATVQRDYKKSVEAVLKLTDYDTEPDREKLERDMADLADQYLYSSLKELSLGKLMQKLLKFMATHRLTIKADFFLMMKALSQVESIGVALDPNFEFISIARPFVQRIQLARLNPKRIVGELFESSTELLGLLREIPGELRSILTQTREGKLKIIFQHRGLDRALSTFDRTSNRVSFSIVLAALIIGSSLIVLSGLPPKWNDIPIIGLLGFLFAGIMGFWLLITILRHGRM